MSPLSPPLDRDPYCPTQEQLERRASALVPRDEPVDPLKQAFAYHVGRALDAKRAEKKES